ncbi:MAG: aminotransferase class I/II-fold pyridoxal phosphate-dependent enzyme [candidate division Zixibacteria bacterium]|nr:aminotransferase class I/II-fold pyridoxal phosphate-dependent enzyme [candidate division Zixibacteria bacterium]
MKNKKRLATLAVDLGEERFSLGALVEPIFQSSTFAFKNSAELKRYLKGEKKLYFYTRYANPTTEFVEKKMAVLEGGQSALATSSGMAAITTTLLALVSSGQEIISTTPLYGGTYRLFKDLFPRLGIKVHFVDAESIEKAEDYVNYKTEVLFIETPTNPNLKIVNIKEGVKIAKKFGLTSVADNTFATPFNQKPLEMGVDVVVHSATKYLAGHSDLIAGVIIGKKDFITRAVAVMKLLGGCLDPLGAFLFLRGLKTLSVRVEKQNQNALKIAQYFSKHPRVRKVYYPGLKNHPQYNLAKSQMKEFGGVVTFELKDLNSAIKLLDNLKVFKNAVSLGGVESLASIPVLSSHYGLDEKMLKKSGVTKGMLRLSCGIEDKEDLIDDLEQALKKVR